MSKEDASRPVIMRDLTDLRSLLPATYETPQSEMGAYSRDMSRLEALQEIFSYSAQERMDKHDRVYGVRLALELSPEERKKNGIQLVALAPLDTTGKLYLEYPEVSSYTVSTSFTDKDGRKHSFYATRQALGREETIVNPLEFRDALHEVDGLTNENAQLYPQTPFDRFKHDVFSVKSTDGLIRPLKSRIDELTARPVNGKRFSGFDERLSNRESTRLNNIKSAVILNTLRSATAIQATMQLEHPLFEVVRDNSVDMLHAKIVFNIPKEVSFSKRIHNDPNEFYFTGGVYQLATNINLEATRENNDLYKRGSDLSHHKVSHEIVQILGL